MLGAILHPEDAACVALLGPAAVVFLFVYWRRRSSDEAADAAATTLGLWCGLIATWGVGALLLLYSCSSD